MFVIETDHRPLVPLVSTKNIDDFPPRVLQLRLIPFNFNIVHVPGKNLITADTLSQASVVQSSPDDKALQSEVAAFIAAVTFQHLTNIWHKFSRTKLVMNFAIMYSPFVQAVGRKKPTSILTPAILGEFSINQKCMAIATSFEIIKLI